MTAGGSEARAQKGAPSRARVRMSMLFHFWQRNKRSSASRPNSRPRSWAQDCLADAGNGRLDAPAARKMRPGLRWNIEALREIIPTPLLRNGSDRVARGPLAPGRTFSLSIGCLTCQNRPQTAALSALFKREVIRDRERYANPETALVLPIVSMPSGRLRRWLCPSGKFKHLRAGTSVAFREGIQRRALV